MNPSATRVQTMDSIAALPEAPLAALQTKLTALGLGNAWPATALLLVHLHSAHIAFGEIYQHPAAELLEALNSATYILSQTESQKYETYAHLLVQETSLGSTSARAHIETQQSDDIWLPHVESFAAFESRQTGVVRLICHFDHGRAQLLHAWLLDQSALRH